MSDKDDNVYQFPSREKLEQLTEADKYNGRDLKEHFDHFLSTLDASVETFMELSAYDKLTLYMTLVEFTHTSLDSYITLKEGK